MIDCVEEFGEEIRCILYARCSQDKGMMLSYLKGNLRAGVVIHSAVFVNHLNRVSQYWLYVTQRDLQMFSF